MTEIPNNQSYQSLKDEASIKDAIDFLSDSWKLILAVGVFGLLGALAFIWVTPSQYEAVALINLAQRDDNNKTDPLNAIIQNPKSIIVKYKLPSTYTSEHIKVCNLEKSKFPQEDMAQLVRLAPVREVDFAVDLRIRLKSKEHAVACAKVIFKSISESQEQIIKPYIEETKTQLLRYQVRLQEVQAWISRADKSDSATLVAYLAIRDELKFLLDETSRLNAIITAGEARHAKLYSPIYVSDAPVFPKKKLSLLIGLLAGLFLGLLLGLVRKAWSHCQAKP